MFGTIYIGNKGFAVSSIYKVLGMHAFFLWNYLLARLERESSNSLFDVLEDWNAYLKQEDIDLSDLSPKLEKRKVRGPSP